MTIHCFGIRHHGPGSARSLLKALKALQPDILLVEGPADAEAALAIAPRPDLKPPVALLVYAPDQPQLAAYYPLATFSPEWQAIRWGLSQQIPVRFMDLPQTHQFALWLAQPQDQNQKDTQTTQEGEGNHPGLNPEPEPSPAPESSDLTPEAEGGADAANSRLPLAVLRHDPLSWLAQAAGYPDGESLWEHWVEQRQNSQDLFTGILEAMTALRAEVEQIPTLQTASVSSDPFAREALREAYMRQTLRAAKKEGFEKIAVVCGAWHTPVLGEPLPPEKADKALLKGLPKVKVNTTWIPWTYQRLTRTSGYGAGIDSPGWYHHLWSHPKQTTIRWLVRVARLLRQADLDASSASVIEAVRLAETLAALRDRPRPGLDDLNEAIRAVLCFGDETPMQLIQRQLLVSDRLGSIPDETPTIPLQQDLQRWQKQLRLKPEAAETLLNLDLRKPNDLERSRLFHRLQLLNVPWGTLQTSSGTGTFKESWRLQWQPEFAIALIEAGIWGNTLLAAATAWSCDRAQQDTSLPPLTHLLDQVLLAALSEAVDPVMAKLQAEAAIATDIAHLMTALPPLATISRYSDVRKTDAASIAQVVDGLVTRICIGLPNACASLNEDAAAKLFEHFLAVNSAIQLLQNELQLQQWHRVLQKLAQQSNLQGLLAGRCCRLLLDAGILSSEGVAQQLSFALSAANDPPQAAAWIEGLLRGSGLLLLHDDPLWQVLDSWLTSLPSDLFTEILPLLRRTFSTFTPAERRQMGEKVRQGSSGVSTLAASGLAEVTDEIARRADQVLPILAQLLGLEVVS